MNTTVKTSEHEVCFQGFIKVRIEVQTSEQIQRKQSATGDRQTGWEEQLGGRETGGATDGSGVRYLTSL